MINPHLHIYVRGEGKLCDKGNPRVMPSEQELRHVVDLGNYTVEELTDLVKEINTAVGEWVANHPPHEE